MQLKQLWTLWQSVVCEKWHVVSLYFGDLTVCLFLDVFYVLQTHHIHVTIDIIDNWMDTLQDGSLCDGLMVTKESDMQLRASLQSQLNN